MARKWGSPKQLKALKKLIAARRAMVRGKGGKARRSVKRRKRNPLRALIANPGSPARLKLIKRRVKARRSLSSASNTRSLLAPVKRRKRRASPRKVTRRKTAKRRTTTRRKVGVSHMAKKRRRRAGTRRITRAVRVPKRYARKYIKRRGSKRRFYINPRRSRRRHRNPGMGGGLLKSSLVSLGAGFVAAGASAVIDKYANGRPMIARVAKLVAALAIAKFGSRYPRAASAAIGGLAASEGYNMATRALGGLQSAQSEGDKVKAVADAASASPAMSALLDGGMGALLDGVPDVANSAYDYNTALANIAGDSDDED